jgi:hypothetical protein
MRAPYVGYWRMEPVWTRRGRKDGLRSGSSEVNAPEGISNKSYGGVSDACSRLSVSLTTDKLPFGRDINEYYRNAGE